MSIIGYYDRTAVQINKPLIEQEKDAWRKAAVKKYIWIQQGKGHWDCNF